MTLCHDHSQRGVRTVSRVQAKTTDMRVHTHTGASTHACTPTSKTRTLVGYMLTLSAGTGNHDASKRSACA